MNAGTHSLAQLQAVDIQSVEPGELTDIRNIKVDKTLPRDARIAEFLRQIGNPYCFRCGKYIVKANFSQSGSSLEDCLKGIIA
ncbi:MAG: DUF6870 family protein [Oscillospiraceae bacterium]|jgi:hypothetical protein